jgi:multimeric flavodoxin WrbA
VPGKRDKRVAARVVGISGSPRKGGNTDSLLEKALEGASLEGSFVEKIFLDDLSVGPCRECGDCYKSGACAFRDDMRQVYDSIRRADSILIASPVFFGTVTAQLKVVIDRCNCLWTAKHILKKRPLPKKKRRGYFLSAAASTTRKQFIDARKVVRNLFATLDIEYAGELFCGGFEDKGAVRADRKAMSRAFLLGKDSARIS